ncbi:thiol:disulfide interchange protein DsbA/DsbL [Microbulbifer taiwanensis]|uniref:Thiol:disulfide interchange protein n=1 Tax=Microbulbifer taiwanensis TaxID=986746 RepID=A0ABW1YQS9_9GAMM|nr:thiol:disulfide interchange protein DsbA/DsbL [Microbulbifer taiwanensis]
MKRLFALSLLLLLGNAFTQAMAQSPVAGEDYIEIPNGRPLAPAEGKVVVEEFFNYICPACNKFEPQFLAWSKQLPAYVRVDHVPAAFRKDFTPYAHAYYTAQIFGLAEETHQAAYDAIHMTRRLPAEGQMPNEKRVAEFYADYGADAQKFLATMQSFSVKSKVRRATEHMQRSKVRSTPSILINGRYLVLGNSFSERLRIARYLIEKEYAGLQLGKAQ